MEASPLKLCCGLTLMLALSHAAVIRTAEGDVQLDSEHLCPCIRKGDCPRVWGTRAEDALLGNFSPCEEEGFVRCCGIKEHDSEEHSIEFLEERKSADRSGSEAQPDRVIPPGIVVPVPFQFPEYVGYETSTATSEPSNPEEAEGSEESGEWVYVDESSEEVWPALSTDLQVASSPALKPGLNEAGGKNIDNTVSQADNFVSFNSLDYRGVDKHSATKGGAGTTTTTTTTSGEISSGNEGDEETSSSSSDDNKKTEEIFVEGETTPSVVHLPDTKEAEVDANGNKEPSKELSTVTMLGTIEPSIRTSKSSDANVSQENKESLEAVDFSEITEPLISQTARTQSTDSRSKNRGKTVTREETSAQNKSEKVINASSNYEEKNSSLTTLYGDDDRYEESYEVGDGKEMKASVTASELGDTTESKGESVNRDRIEISTQERSESAIKESSKVEEKSSSNVRNTVSENGEENSELSDGIERDMIPRVRKPTSFKRPRIGARGSGDKTSRGLRTETTSQLKTETAKKESSNFEESKTSKVEKVVTSTAGQSGGNVNSAIFDRSASQAPNVAQLNTSRRPAHRPRGKFNRGQRQETIVEQKSESTKKESSTVEESKTSSVESSSTNIETNSDRSSGAGSTGGFFKKMEQNKESSSSEKSSSFNSERSKTEEVTIDGGNSSVVSKEEKKETSDNSEKSESTKDESFTEQKESSLIFEEPAVVDDVTELGTIPSKIPEIETGKGPESNKETITAPVPNENLTASGGSSSGETSTPPLNLMNMLAGKFPSNSEPSSEFSNNGNSNEIPSRANENTSGMNKAQSVGVRHAANRAYVPVLINAGFLKDRPLSTGPVGLDPISGVTHSDITNPQLAPELLPLSCGNVIFGERIRNGKTLVCDIPQSVGALVRFYEENMTPLSQGKLHGPPFPGAVLPVGILTAGDGVESPESTMATTGENRTQRPVRKRIVVKRPASIAAEEIVRGKEISASKPPPLIRRGSDTRKQLEANVNEENDRVVEAPVKIGSAQTVKDSISGSESASSSWNFTSSQESVSTSNSSKETSEAEFKVTAEDLLKADREAEAVNSKFYLLPLAPTLPPRPKDSRSSRAKNLTTVTPATLATSEPAEVTKVVEVVSETPPRRTKIGRRRQKVFLGKKLPSSDPQVGGNQFVISDEVSGSSTAVYNRNARRVTPFAPDRPHPERDVISADEISPSGRVHIVGPIPTGFYDPVEETNQPLIGLPNQKSSSDDFHPRGSGTTRDGSEAQKDATFKPSPNDSINWQ